MDKVVHFEIPADNVERAQKFYGKVFGWKMNPVPDMKYTMVSTVETDKKMMPKEPGAINGGMFQRNEQLKNTMITINVVSIDATLKNLEKNDGKVVRGKVDVGDMGFVAYFKDTEGNIIGLWENAKR